MTIAYSVLREKVRRKDMYIIAIIGIVFAALITSGNSSVMVGNTSITGYEGLLPVSLVLVGITAGALAIALSLSTIPNEYSRSTSHLIWIRGIKQPIYHASLALGNIISSLMVLTIMFTSVVWLMLSRGMTGDLIRLPVAFLLACLPVIISSMFASALSVKLPQIAAGTISALLLICGYLHTLLGTLINISGGGISSVLRLILVIIPDLYTLQFQATLYIRGQALDYHRITGGLLCVYILAQLIWIQNRRYA